MTPLAALANDDMAVADNGGMPSIAGGGGRSEGSSAVPFELGGRGSPPAVTGMAAAKAARRPSGVSGPLSSGVLTFVFGARDSALTSSADLNAHMQVCDVLGLLAWTWSVHGIVGGELCPGLPAISIQTAFQAEAGLTLC